MQRRLFLQNTLGVAAVSVIGGGRQSATVIRNDSLNIRT
jgi:hypothetical protein